MSNIGKKPIVVPDGVNVDISNNSVNVKGKNGELYLEYNSIIEISKKQNGFYGGRIMGGGFGGCCLSLIADSKKDLFIENLVTEFYKQFSYDLRIEYINFCDGLTIGK